MNPLLDDKTVHVMIDLETWGTGPMAAVSTIGAVKMPFIREYADELGRLAMSLTTHAKFYGAITLESALLAGLEVDAETVGWWRGQSAEARHEMVSVVRKPLVEVLEAFRAFLPAEGDFLIWGNGAAADPVWLESAFRAAGMPVPWKHWQVRCYRTMKALYQGRVEKRKFEGTGHHALADARYQMDHLQLMLGRARREGLGPQRVYFDKEGNAMTPGELLAPVMTGAEGRREPDTLEAVAAADFAAREGGPVS